MAPGVDRHPHAAAGPCPRGGRIRGEGSLAGRAASRAAREGLPGDAGAIRGGPAGEFRPGEARAHTHRPFGACGCSTGMTRLLPLALALLVGSAAGAHEVRPAYLEITEPAPAHSAILWRTP